MTNVEMILAMSVEELAEFMASFGPEKFCRNLDYCIADADDEKEIPLTRCVDCALAWLKEEARSDEA